MNVDYSKDFKKSVQKLSGKKLDSVRRVVEEVKHAESLKDITDCKKLVGYRSVYRIRIGDYRAFFTFHVEIINDTVFFRYLVPRGEAYGKKNHKELKRIDK
ncbi:MAG: type II toxin-antitoxin system RelE/ParE family toxin [Prevotella sp.]